MKKLKHKQATVRPNNTSIIIYYSYQGKEMRFPTGISINSAKDKDGKYIHWDYKTSRLKLPKLTGSNYNAVQALQVQQKTIDHLLETANSLINNSFTKGN